jgi:lipoate-protein ligase B
MMSAQAKICWVVDAGLMAYGPAWEWQRQLVEARKRGAAPDVLVLCEHPHVITLGRNGKREHLRASESVLRQMRIEFHATDRGGDITYHGPGQIVGYPILDLAQHRRDVRWYVDRLEEVMIRVSEDFGVKARRAPDMHGVWVDTPAGEEKLGALGVHLSRWVTSHGFAYNATTDLRYFDWIVPCGIRGKGVTSLEKVLGDGAVHCGDVKLRVAAEFGKVFGCEMRTATKAELEQRVGAAAAA